MTNKNVKKIAVLILGLLLSTPLFVFASVGFSLKPATGNYKIGDVFSVALFVNPQSNKIYTAKVELLYPANLLSVESFNFDDAWLPLKQPGYDLVDNTNGILIKTAGYPGGLSSDTRLGTVIFRVKSSGSATLNIGSNSIALDSNNANLFDNMPIQAVFTFSTPQPQLPAENIPVRKSPKVETKATTKPPIEIPPKPSLLALAVLSVLNIISPVGWLIVALIVLFVLILLPRKYWGKEIKFSKIKKLFTSIEE
jgi:hypothetical protein